MEGGEWSTTTEAEKLEAISVILMDGDGARQDVKTNKEESLGISKLSSPRK